MIMPSFLFFLAPLAWSSKPPPRNVSELCIEFLGTDVHYSFVLQGDGTYTRLSSAHASTKSYLPIEKVLSEVSSREQVIQNVPLLADLEWRRDGHLAFAASTSVALYQIRGDSLTIELTLPPGIAGQEIVRHLLQSLERENVAAMISGLRTRISIYRLALNDVGTQRALNDFLSFMKMRDEAID